jgi:hypothetical protein
MQPVDRLVSIALLNLSKKGAGRGGAESLTVCPLETAQFLTRTKYPPMAIFKYGGNQQTRRWHQKSGKVLLSTDWYHSIYRVHPITGKRSKRWARTGVSKAKAGNKQGNKMNFKNDSTSIHAGFKASLERFRRVCY